jgi:glucokinase
MNGQLYSGHQGLAGELGHFEVVPGGELCRCGKRGCLETLVNQNAIFREYVKKVLKKEEAARAPSQERIAAGLADLFGRAAGGEASAVKVVETIAGHLGPPMAQMIMLFNIRDVILSGYFGPHGSVLVRALQKEIDRTILSKMEYSLRYCPFDEKGFTIGAALLVLRRYLSEVPPHLSAAR